MLKGLFSLIVTGILFNPCVFLGGLAGILAYIKLSTQQLEVLCFNYHLYLLFFIFSFLYIRFFKKSLKDDLVHIDWKATFSNIIKHFLLMTFSFFVGLLLASYFDFSMPEPKKGTESEYSEIMSLQKQVQDWQNNYNEMLNKIK